MTLDDLIEKVGSKLRNDPNYWYGSVKEPKKGFLKTWTLGGTYGGAWGEGTFEAEPEPEWHDLHDFLEEVCPNIRILQYMRLMRLTDTGSKSDDDYYSKRQEGYRWLSIERLYHFLKDEGLL